MSGKNPYHSPEGSSPTPPRGSSLRLLGAVVLVAGMLTMAYGAVAFWLIPSLPPNGGPMGRVPCLYVIGAGIVASLVGLVLRSGGAAKPESAAKPRGIPTSYGLLILLAILILVGLIIANL